MHYTTSLENINVFNKVFLCIYTCIMVKRVKKAGPLAHMWKLQLEAANQNKNTFLYS
jgi:hypothetical protein